MVLFFNRSFDKNRIKSLISWSLVRFGEKRTIDLVEKLKDIGFYYATQAGVSLGIDDLKIPPTKPFLVSQSETQVQTTNHDFEKGNLTSVERFQKMIDTWHRTSETLRQDVVQNFRSTDSLNPVFMMAFSGARGNLSQVRQLVAMRGLMADPQGQIIDFPIRSNFREGLTLTEYVISCYGARKGLVDTALRTANSGYLTRRLVDVSHHVIVRQLNCKTRRGLVLTEMRERKKVIRSLQNRLIGRVLAEDIAPVAFRNQDISPELSAQIVKLRTQVLVRSPLTCETKNSICQLCYGWSLADGNLVSLGEAVGILAAQSIGEPGTQLTMRTFHTGGVFSGDLMDEIRAPFDGQISFDQPLQGRLIRTSHGQISFLTKVDGQLLVTNFQDQQTVTYSIPSATVLFVRAGETVEKKQLIAEISSQSTQSNQRIRSKYKVNAPLEGEIYFHDVIFAKKTDKDGEITRIGLKLGALWIRSGKIYQSSVPSPIFPQIGDLINKTTIMNQSQFFAPYNGYLKADRSLFSQPPDISLNQRILQFNLNQIVYKRFSYFVSLASSQSTFFLSTSFQTLNHSIQQIFLTWFQNKYTPSTGGTSLILDLYLKENFTSGEFFWIPEQWLAGSAVEIDSSAAISQKSGGKKPTTKNFALQTKPTCSLIDSYWITKNSPLFIQTNKQGQEKVIYSDQNGRLDIFGPQCFSETVSNKANQSGNKIKKNWKTTIYRNPQSQFNKHTLSISIQKDLPPISNLSDDSTSSQSKNSLGPLVIQPNKFKQVSQLRLKSGWVYLPRDWKKTFDLSNSIHFPGRSIVDTIVFDQHVLFVEHFILSPSLVEDRFPGPKFIVKNSRINRPRVFKKPIQNVFFSCNQLIGYNFQQLPYKQLNGTPINHFPQNGIALNNFSTRTSQSYSIISHQANVQTVFVSFDSGGKIELESEFKKKNFVFNFPTKFSFKVYRTVGKMVYCKPKIVLLFRQPIQYSLFDLTRCKNQFLQLTSQNTKDQIFIKQNLSELVDQFSGVDVNPYFPSFQNRFAFQRKYKNGLCLVPIFFSFSCSKNFPFQRANFSITQNCWLNLSVQKKLTISDSMTNIGPLNQTDIFVQNQNQVGETDPITVTSFLSSYQGEIVNLATDPIGNQKSLILTKQDQTSFATYGNPLQVSIGQFLCYGDKFISNYGVTQSGQILQLEKNRLTLRKAHPILFPPSTLLHVDQGDYVEKNSSLVTLFYQRLKTGDIVQGIPKIEELFEARQAKEGSSFKDNVHTKLRTFFEVYKQNFSPQEAARISIEKIQQILVNGVQQVYQSQGVTIADKHIEIIVRQMTSKVKIVESGQTGLLRGELIDLQWIEIVNLGIESQNQLFSQGIPAQKAEYEPVLLGITKASLETESFISAASFQETTRILSRAAIERKTDFLRGLKENVILGRLIPAGTGFSLSFDPQIRVAGVLMKLSWLNYKEMVKFFGSKENKIG